MKKRNLLTGLAVASIFVIMAAGCKKNNDSSNSAGIGATINGAAWQAQASAGVEADSFITLIGYVIKSGDTTAIELDISDTTHVGQPDAFYSSSASYITKTGIYSGDDFAGGHGTITVSSWDKTAHKVVGTFSGVFKNYSNIDDSISIQNGHFNSTYIVQ